MLNTHIFSLASYPGVQGEEERAKYEAIILKLPISLSSTWEKL